MADGFIAKISENRAKYFKRGVIEPLKAKGIAPGFYDSDNTIFPASRTCETAAEAEKQKEERMINDIDAKYAIYSFI